VQELKIAKSVKFIASVDRSHVLAIATVRDKARFQLIDAVNGKTIRRSAGIEPSYLEKMFLSPDKSLAAVTDISGDVVICNLETMALRTLDNGLSGSDSVAFSRDAKTFFVGGEDQNLSLYDTKSLKRQWTLLSEFKPGPAETRLTEERAVRVAEIIKRKE
jgi:WD40 repeat protein